jgi:DNA-binding MarR family transcriptional regulator
MPDRGPRTVAEEIGQRIPFRSRGQEAMVALLRTADVIRWTLGQGMAGEGLTLQQYNVLRILRGAGPQGLPTLEIGSRMVERHPGVTRLVDRLVKKGLVDRTRGSADRRLVLCSITPRGLVVLKRLDGVVEAADHAVLEALGEEEVTELIAALDVLRAGLRDAEE